MRISADALGGLQSVGHILQPDDDPIAAGQWLAHTLTKSRREKLSLSQIVFIFRQAFNVAEHEGFQTFAACCGYTATPTACEAELVHAVKRAEVLARETQEAARDLTMLIDNPELLARMTAAGLKVGRL